MTNWKQIIKILGILLHIEGGQLLICMIVALLYGESILPFLWPVLICLVVGAIGMLIGKGAGANMGRRDGYIIVSVVWILFSLIGLMPFMIDGCIPDFSSAFFETMSGFTSTGATVIDNIDVLPHGILFWRSLTQWIGGIGIIFFTIAILPAFGIGEVKLFAAEATGPLHNKVHPRISVAARWIGTVYLGLTVLCIISLLICGMDTFDAINLSMTCTATGGYATHSALLHEVYNSPAIEYVLTFFMFFSGVNYTLLYYTMLKGRVRQFFHDSELKTFLFIMLTATIVCTVTLMMYNDKGDLELSFRESIFTVVSMQTTTGFAVCDYTLWPELLMPVLLFVMFAGACSGSTSGGFKCIRISILLNIIRNEFKHILHPRAVIPVKLGDNVINSAIVRTLIAFVSLFVGALFVGAFILALCGVDTDIAQSMTEAAPRQDHTEAFSLAMSALSNVGPAVGYYGPAHSWAIISPLAKMVCSFLMLIGRLELFPILILFSRSFWKQR